jgi:alkanesulfonate monooxygenase SsuD/methylene tetrahydromethanopterin reductase-like flavin-dependent oxidoreductase (luciferase family)
LAAAAEELGAAAILVADEGTDRDLFVTLATLAPRTRQAILVAAVTNPHSRHPVATAAAFATLAELAPRRVVAGFGTGGSRVLGPMGLAPGRPYTALVECLDVFEALLRGEVVDHSGEFAVRSASLPWNRGRSLPIAIAGRHPRVERLAAERADWVLLAGRALQDVSELVARLRRIGTVARGWPPAIAWNPTAGWTDAMIADLRAHFAYMAVDMPAADRRALGLDDSQIEAIREIVNTSGPEAAAPQLGDAVLQRYAVAGERREVIARLAELRRQVQPELLLFDAGDYSTAYLEDVAGVAHDVGAVLGPIKCATHE